MTRKLISYILCLSKRLLKITWKVDDKLNHKLSIKKIAQLTGVSTATVSRVINDNGRFSEETRKRVQSAIEKYGYEPNRVAKSLRVNKSNTVGIIVPDITNSFFSSTVQQIEVYLFDHGYSTIICNTAHNQEKESKYLKVLESEMVDGIIIISGALDFKSTDLHSKLPLICIDRNPKDDNALFVGSDHYAGAVLATEYLVKEVQDITIVLPDRKSVSPLERLRGFSDTVKKYPAIKTAIFLDDGNEERLQRFLVQKKSTNNIFGIFANSDNLAAKILLQAHLLGINVPKQMKLIGFDDAPIAQICYPQLTTIRQNEKEIAELAGEKLIKLITRIPIQGKKSIRVPVKLIIRGTT